MCVCGEEAKCEIECMGENYFNLEWVCREEREESIQIDGWEKERRNYDENERKPASNTWIALKTACESSNTRIATFGYFKTFFAENNTTRAVADAAFVLHVDVVTWFMLLNCVPFASNSYCFCFFFSVFFCQFSDSIGVILGINGSRIWMNSIHKTNDWKHGYLESDFRYK